MLTFITQDERVESVGLLATPCILGHCCSESGQSKKKTFHFPTRKEKAYSVNSSVALSFLC